MGPSPSPLPSPCPAHLLLLCKDLCSPLLGGDGAGPWAIRGLVKSWTPQGCLQFSKRGDSPALCLLDSNHIPQRGVLPASQLPHPTQGESLPIKDELPGIMVRLLGRGTLRPLRLLILLLGPCVCQMMVAPGYLGEASMPPGNWTAKAKQGPLVTRGK